MDAECMYCLTETGLVLLMFGFINSVKVLPHIFTSSEVESLGETTFHCSHVARGKQMFAHMYPIW